MLFEHQAMGVATSSSADDTAAEAAERATLEARVHELREVREGEKTGCETHTHGKPAWAASVCGL